MARTKNPQDPHQHDHHHHGQHHHQAISNLKVAFFLNLFFTLIEIAGGILTNSVAILSDALHDLGDSLSLGLAWYLQGVAARDRDQKFSYGYARFSVLGALINSLILIAGAVFIMVETVPRLMDPEQPHVEGMLGFAVLGIVVNGAAVLRLRGSESLNEQVVMWHLLEDVLGWVAIFVGSIVMMFVDAPILDPLMSLLIMVIIAYNVIKNIGKSFRIFLQATPSRMDLDKIRKKIHGIPQVVDVHDFHLWTLDGQYHIATLHIAVRGIEGLNQTEPIKKEVRELLFEFDIEHVTIEIEEEGVECEVNCD